MSIDPRCLQCPHSVGWAYYPDVQCAANLTPDPEGKCFVFAERLAESRLDGDDYDYDYDYDDED